MKSRTEKLAAVGLDASRLGDLQALPHVEPTTGEGAGSPAAILTLAMLWNDPSVQGVPVRPAAADRAGVSVARVANAERPAVIIKDKAGRPFRTVMPGAGADAKVTDQDSSRVVAVLHDGIIKLLRDDDTGVVIMAGEDGAHEIAPVYASDVTAPALVRLDAPIASWSKGVEPWLSRELGAFGDGVWDDVLATGLLLRHEHVPLEGATARLHKLLAGASSPVSPIVTWLQGEPPQKRDSALRLTLAELDLLYRELDELQREPRVSDEDWWQQVEDVCVRRELVEGTCELLEGVGMTGALQRSVELLDARGRRFIDAIPASHSFSHELLWKGAVLEPAAWWTTWAKPPQP